MMQQSPEGLAKISMMHHFAPAIEKVNITVRRSRQSGVARATCPD